jgi:hypothetical protein
MPEARSRRWPLWTLAMCGLVLVIVAVGVIFVRLVVLRDTARSVSTDEAVDRFRVVASSTPTPAPTAQETTLVAAGVYRYRTSGDERIDALDGAEHRYPAETTITVVAADCGVSLRWDALRERWDEWQLCLTDAGIELGASGTQYHEFFGQPERETVSCDRGALLVPSAPPPDEPAELSCTLADDPWQPTWTVLERTTRDVDGRSVAVQHVRMHIADDDEYWETTTIDWFLADSGLPVEVVADKSSSSPSPIGPIRYDEQYRLELVSTSPMR